MKKKTHDNIVMDPYNGVIGSLVKTVLTKIVYHELGDNVTGENKNMLVNKILNNPRVLSKLSEIETRVGSQGKLGALMTVQEIVGLIPIPEVPDIINAGIDMGYQGIKTIGTAEEVRNSVDIISQLLDNPSNKLNGLSLKSIFLNPELHIFSLETFPPYKSHIT